jgi:hypothetical protein
VDVPEDFPVLTALDRLELGGIGCMLATGRATRLAPERVWAGRTTPSGQAKCRRHPSWVPAVKLDSPFTEQE